MSFESSVCNTRILHNSAVLSAFYHIRSEWSAFCLGFSSFKYADFNHCNVAACNCNCLIKLRIESFPLSFCRTLSSSDDVQDRETEKGRLEDAFEISDRDLDKLIVQHYAELTTAIRTYQSITERITSSRNKIKQVGTTCWENGNWKGCENLCKDLILSFRLISERELQTLSFNMKEMFIFLIIQ